MTKSTPSIMLLGSICLALLCPITVYAHPGKVNADGCHTERKTGDYHCHPERAKPATTTAPAASEPVLSPAASTPADSNAANTSEAPATVGDLMKIDYQGFTLWIDCKQRGAVRFEYIARRDSGNLPRAKDFSLDQEVPKECQQFSAAAYGHGYDRGHQVPANHLDGSPVAIQQSNFMTNILPQVAQMNRGAWERTEEIIECYRDLEDLRVIGGVIWGNNPADDYFVQSHGVKTPDAYWKVVIRGTGQDQRAIAWVVPNSALATKSNLDQYLISVGNLEQMTGETIPVAAYAKHDKPAASWHIPHGCNKG